MSELRCGDEILWVDHDFVPICDVFDGNGVDVMDEDLLMDFEALYAKITAIVSNDYVITDVFPLMRAVKRLVYVPIKTKRYSANVAFEFEVLIPLLESLESCQLTIGSYHS